MDVPDNPKCCQRLMSSAKAKRPLTAPPPPLPLSETPPSPPPALPPLLFSFPFPSCPMHPVSFMMESDDSLATPPLPQHPPPPPPPSCPAPDPSPSRDIPPGPSAAPGALNVVRNSGPSPPRHALPDPSAALLTDGRDPLYYHNALPTPGAGLEEDDIGTPPTTHPLTLAPSAGLNAGLGVVAPDSSPPQEPQYKDITYFAHLTSNVEGTAEYVLGPVPHPPPPPGPNPSQDQDPPQSPPTPTKVPHSDRQVSEARAREGSSADTVRETGVRPIPGASKGASWEIYKKGEESSLELSFCAWSPRREKACQQCAKAPLWSRRDLAWPPTYWT